MDWWNRVLYWLWPNKVEPRPADHKMSGKHNVVIDAELPEVMGDDNVIIGSLEILRMSSTIAIGHNARADAGFIAIGANAYAGERKEEEEILGPRCAEDFLSH